jgi:hypothetical protein
VIVSKFNSLKPFVKFLFKKFWLALILVGSSTAGLCYSWTHLTNGNPSAITIGSTIINVVAWFCVIFFGHKTYKLYKEMGWDL